MTTCLGVTMVRRDSYNTNNGVITLPILKLMNKTQWQIGQSDYDKHSWDTIFKMIVSADIQKLEIQRTYNSAVLKNIEQIEFGQLLLLNLQVNNIINIEPLCKINAPSLEKLRLCSFCKIKPIISLFQPDHQQNLDLMIEGNFIKQFDFFCQTNFNKKFKTLSLQTWNEKKCQGQSLKWLAKSKLTYLLEIYCESERRMNQSRIKAALKRKLQKIDFKRLVHQQ